MILDDRSRAGPDTPLGTAWRLVSDRVMGGVSSGRLVPDSVDGRPCLHLTGEVSLDNNGGFLQASLDLSETGYLDASAYSGIELEVLGNGEDYNLHLRTGDTTLVWQSYRATFPTAPTWRTLRLPFAGFSPYRIDRALDLAHLRRLGIVAIGRPMQADVFIARLNLYR
jgi:hypothetical protein